jgi:hypothetical protein
LILGFISLILIYCNLVNSSILSKVFVFSKYLIFGDWGRDPYNVEDVLLEYSNRTKLRLTSWVAIIVRRGSLILGGRFVYLIHLILIMLASLFQAVRAHIRWGMSLKIRFNFLIPYLLSWLKLLDLMIRFSEIFRNLEDIIKLIAIRAFLVFFLNLSVVTIKADLYYLLVSNNYSLY